MLERETSSESTRPYEIARSAAELAVLSVISPIAGTTVEITLAQRFGTSAAVDAFRIAAAIVHMGQQLFLAVFPGVIVPLFAEHQSSGNEAVAWRSLMELARLAMIPTATLSLILFTVPGPALSIIAPGLGPQAREWACFFLRWFGLSLIPLLYSGAAIGLLYAQRIFWTASAGQLAYNLVLFATILVFGGALLGPVSIMVGVLLATSAFLLLQVLKLMPAIHGAHIRQRHAEPSLVRASVSKGIRLGLPLLALPLMNQAIAIVAVRSLAASSVGTIAAMGYAGKLLQTALAFPDVMGTVLFPRFAAMARASDRKRLQELSTRAMRMALFIGLPIACILFVLRAPLVELLFCHGAFSQTAARRVGVLFGLSLMGMPARAVFFHQARILYALEDTWWPACATFLSMLLATMAVPTAAHNFDAEGVVAIFAVLGWLGAIVLGYVLRSKYAACQGSALFLFALRILGPAVGTAWLGSAAVQLIDPMFASRTLELMFKISAATSVASLSYWLTAIVVRIPEALEIRRYIRWQSASALSAVKAVIYG